MSINENVFTLIKSFRGQLYLAGHSLGGVMLEQYLQDQVEIISHLIYYHLLNFYEI